MGPVFGSVASNNNVRIIDHDASVEVSAAASQIQLAARHLRRGAETAGVQTMRQVRGMMNNLRWISSNVGVEAATEFRVGVQEIVAVLGDSTTVLADTTREESRMFAQSLLQASRILASGGVDIAEALKDIGGQPIRDLRDWLYGPVHIISACILAFTVAYVSPFVANVAKWLEPYHTTVAERWSVGVVGFSLAVISVAVYVCVRSLMAEVRVLTQQTHWLLSERHNAVLQEVPPATVPLPVIVPPPTHPTGFVGQYAGLHAPEGWLVCNGRVLDVINHPEYRALAQVLGHRYVNGVHGQAFRLPDFGGRVGVGPTAGVTLGSSDGSSTAVLTVANLPAHNHHIGNAGAHRHAERLEYGGLPFGFAPGGRYNQLSTAPDIQMDPMTNIMDLAGDHRHACGDTGNGLAFSVMNPYVCVNYIIKL